MPPKSKGRPSKSVFKASPSSAKPRSSTPPAPFSLPPSQLQPFLSELSKKHIYITSLDSFPRPLKTKIFLVPVATNLLITAFIVWRIIYIVPHYILLATSFSSDFSPSSFTLSVILQRFLSFVFDYLIYAVLLPWPREFLLGTKHGSPAQWRANIGFRDCEIIVRRSRPWDVNVVVPGVDIVHEHDNLARRMFDEEARRATSMTGMHEKSGYLLLNAKWDLDWNLMIFATQMVDTKDASLPNFMTQVLVHTQEYGWIVWDENAQGGNKEEDGRKKIVSFKDELTAMGKEGLFFRWIELVQYESAKDGGFTAERQQDTMKKANEMFEREGVDFEAFWGKVGGMKEMPGMQLS